MNIELDKSIPLNIGKQTCIRVIYNDKHYVILSKNKILSHNDKKGKGGTVYGIFKDACNLFKYNDDYCIAFNEYGGTDVYAFIYGDSVYIKEYRNVQFIHR